MTLNFYTLGVLYLVYSFLGWVGETVVATFRGKRFANRGMAAGPFCFVYGTTAILMAVGFADMRTKPVALFVACMLTATVVEWLTAKLLERLHNRKWWDYSDKKFNLNGYVCLQYSVLWGALGMVTVLWGNGLLLRLCALVPDWLRCIRHTSTGRRSFGTSIWNFMQVMYPERKCPAAGLVPCNNSVRERWISGINKMLSAKTLSNRMRKAGKRNADEG